MSSIYQSEDAIDTIAAIATPAGQGGVAVIRVSGPAAWRIAGALFSKKISFRPGRFYHGWIADPDAPDTPVDEVLLLTFKAPKSYTGDDVMEIHCHGGGVVSHKILDLCFTQGARPAEPGEFTKRAFLAGKMDLTQAESVMDLIAAKGEAALRLASANIKNRSLGKYLDEMREALIGVQSLIVSSVDFPDEVDEPDRADLQHQLTRIREQIHVLEAAAHKNRLVKDGLKVAILGMPNSGKSSLFNRLLSAERAIVTDIAGTTRDVITESLEMNGIPVTLIDTAGIRESADTVEIIGVERSWLAADEAHAMMYVYDGAVGLVAEDRRILEKLEQTGRTVLQIANKADVMNGKQPDDNALMLSAKTGQGLEELYRWLEAAVSEAGGDSGTPSISLNRRQLACLSEMAGHLDDADHALSDAHLPLDLVTVPLSDALRCLDRLSGHDTTEEVLTSVFQQFCVGK